MPKMPFSMLVLRHLQAVMVSLFPFLPGLLFPVLPQIRFFSQAHDKTAAFRVLETARLQLKFPIKFVAMFFCANRLRGGCFSQNF
jgi:hypothetical protein